MARCVGRCSCERPALNALPFDHRTPQAGTPDWPGSGPPGAISPDSTARWRPSTAASDDGARWSGSGSSMCSASTPRTVRLSGRSGISPRPSRAKTPRYQRRGLTVRSGRTIYGRPGPAWRVSSGPATMSCVVWSTPPGSGGAPRSSAPRPARRGAESRIGRRRRTAGHKE